jgi:hypothetical protein
MTMTYDNLNIRGVPSRTFSRNGVDDFTRSVTVSDTGDLGTGPLGTWTKTTSGDVVYHGTAQLGVNGTEAVAHWVSGDYGDSGACILNGRQWTLPVELLLTLRGAGTGGTGSGIRVSLVNGSDYLLAQAGVAAGGGGVTGVDTSNMDGDGWYGLNGRSMAATDVRKFRVLITEAGMQVREWKASLAEPSNWDMEMPPYGSQPAGWIASWIANADLVLRIDCQNGNDNYVQSLEIIRGAVGCIGVSPVSPTSVGSVGGSACDELVPQGPPDVVGGVSYYPSGTTWKTTRATYLPGSSKLAVDGIFKFGQYVETDPDTGIVTANLAISTTAVVTLCYVTNGPLP